MTYKEAIETLNYMIISRQSTLKALPERAAKGSYINSEIKALKFAIKELSKKG